MTSGWSGKRVAVTGAGGFLGRLLCLGLREAGAEVSAQVRQRPAPPGIPSVRLDLEEAERSARWLRDCAPECVFHLAAPINLRREVEWVPLLSAGLTRPSFTLARVSLELGARFVLVSSCEVYGDGEAPFREEQAPRPVSAYSLAKLAAEQEADFLHRVHGLDLVTLRPFLSFGPEQRSQRLIPSAIQAALRGEEFPMTDGLQTREFNDGRDIVRGMMTAALAGAGGRVYNLGGGAELRVLDLVHRIFELAGADPRRVLAGALPRRGGEVQRFVGCHQRALTELGHRPAHGLEESLQRCVESWRPRC